MLARLDQRRAWRWFAGFSACLLVLALPWPGLREGFARAYSGSLDLVLLDHITFGKGGHARLRAASVEERKIEAHVATDAVLVLRVEGHTGTLDVGMSLRRDAYLPIVMIIALIAAAPLPWRRRGHALAIGVPVTVGLTIACQWLGALWMFCNRLPSVVPLGALAHAIVDGSFDLLLLPPANRFVVPLLVGLGLVWWQARRSVISLRPQGFSTAS